MSKSKLYFLFLIFIFSIISISSLIADEDINFNLGRSIEDNLWKQETYDTMKNVCKKNPDYLLE